MRTATVWVLLAAACVPAVADEVVVGRVPYSAVNVTGFTGGRLVFLIRGRSNTRALSDITRITLDGRKDFNEAEGQLNTDPAKAARLYGQALRQARADWERLLIEHRRLDALGRAGQTADWTRHWVALVSSPKATAAEAALEPAKLGADEDVRKAAEYIAERIDRIRLPAGKKAAEALLERFRRQAGGDGDERPEPSEKPAPKPGPSAEEPAVDVEVERSSVGQLGRIEDLLRRGQAAPAAEMLDEFIPKARSRELPRALFLAGVARLKLAQAAADPVKRLGEAGLMFMKVAVFYPRDKNAPEALYRAAEIVQSLNDPPAANALYQRLLTRYKDSPFAAEAAKKLATPAETTASEGG